MPISNILGTLDNKAENCRKRIPLLLKTLDSLYNYWFEEFEYKNEKGLPYKNSNGPMEQKGNLHLPCEFRLLSIGDMTVLLKDGTHNPPTRIAEGIPLLTGTMFGEIFLSYKDVTYISVDDYTSIHSKYKPQANDLIITKIGTIGNVNILREKDIPIAIHCNSAILRFRDEFDGAYSFMLLRSKYFQKQLKASKGQSIQEFISLDKLSNIIVPVPPAKVISRFNQTANVILKKIEKIEEELNSVLSLKNTILPLLMNGQLQVIN